MRSSLKDQKQIVKRSMNKNEWTRELDQFIMQSVVRNYFNFQIVSLEADAEAKRLCLDFGSSNVVTSEKCRLRWSYLHLQRKMGKQVVYKSLTSYLSASDSDTNKENANIINSSSNRVIASKDQKLIKQNAPKIISEIENPKQLIEAKSFKNLTDKNAAKTMHEIEANIWKNNIKSGRKDKDFLDTSKEDFSLNKTKGIDGYDVAPSSFNIFRDSLRQQSEKLMITLNQHLPDMNLKEIEESESEKDDMSDADVLPLDFRTALLEEECRVVIQAKPLQLKLDVKEEFDDRDPSKRGLDSYLEMVKKEAFKDDEGAAIIDPGYDIKAKFEEIDLPCNSQRRLNNTINAPLRPITPIEASADSRKKGPKSNKQYDTDTGASNSEAEEAKQAMKKNIQSIKYQSAKFGEARSLEQVQTSETFGTPSNDPLNFENSLKQAEETTTSNDLKSSKQREDRFERILQENREAMKKQEEDDIKDFTNKQMMDDLEALANEEEDNQEISDTAPVSPYADALSVQEEAEIAQKQKENDFKNTVKQISSASETDEEKKNKAQNQNDLQRTDNQKQKESQDKNNKKVKFYKGMRVMSKDGEEEDADSKNSSQFSQGSADDYFEMQRKNLKNKQTGTLNKQPKPLFVKKESTKQAGKREIYNSDSEDDDDEFQKRIEQEKLAQIKLIQKKKEEAQKERQIKLMNQNIAKQQEMDKRNKEKEALMQRLKEQDAETKRRKKEEKEEKENELKRYRKMQEDKIQDEEDRKQREHDFKMLKRRSEEKEKKLVEQELFRKNEDEEEITSVEKWKEFGKSDIPCFYDSKCSYLSQINVLPWEIELKIQNNQLSQEQSNKLKMLTIPIGSHINNDVLSSIIQYFLLNSNMQKVLEKQQTQEDMIKNSFPYRCVSMQMAVTEAPLQALSINQKPGIQMQNKDSVIRVLSLLFDISDEPRLRKIDFKGATKRILLKDILNQKQIKSIGQHYKYFITDLAHKYQRVSRINAFPFEITVANKNIIQFKNQNDLEINFESALLSQLAFFSDYTKKTDVIPAINKDSWEFFRRSPTFYSYNGNKASYTRMDKIKNRIATKNNDFNYEDVCVVFKDLSFEPLQKCKSSNSLAHFFKKATIKEGLDIIGLKLVYLDDKNRQEYYSIFHENIEMDSTWERPVLALVVRGIDAVKKTETILGHFNPDLARRTNQKSLRSCFGRTREQNCTFPLHSKKNLDIKFWFGGRIQKSVNENNLEKNNEGKRNQIFMIVPPKIEKHLLLISPCLPTSKLPKIIQRLTLMGATILDIQKLDYNNLSYQNENIKNLKQEAITQIRGKTYKTSIGYVIKIARENLYSQFVSQRKQIERDLDGLLEEQTVENLLFITNNFDEYKRVLGILKKHNFKVNYMNAKAGGSDGYSASRRKTDAEFDSDDPSEFCSIQMYNQLEIKNQAKATKTKITAIKKKINQEFGEQYQIQTFVCFIKISTFKKQVIGDILEGLLNKFDFELLGLKVINGKKQIYKDNVSISVINTLKAIAFKFHEASTDLKLRKKVKEFKTFALILRGQDVEKQIDTIYDRHTCKFLDQGSAIFKDQIFETSPSVLFLTNKHTSKTFIDFITETKYIRLFQDMKQNFKFLNGSINYFEHINLPDDNIFETQKVAEIKQTSDLLDKTYFEEDQAEQPSQATLIIKPNQPQHVVMRALKQIANINGEKMNYNDQNYVSVTKIELHEGYNQTQIHLLFKHDILYDQNISKSQKEKMKTRYPQIFEGHPVWQIMISGINAIHKLQKIIGYSDPEVKQGNKDALRQTYGNDRMDNAFFISETIEEAKIEQQKLFDQTSNCDKYIDQDKEFYVKRIDDVKVGSDSYDKFQLQRMELALVVISPALVRNNDFIYVLDEFQRAKLNICALKKKKVDRINLEYLFKDLAPKTHSLSTLENEFNRGESVILVVEKQNAISEVQELIGNFSIKINSDYEKKKSKQQIGYQVNKQSNLISEYGSYIFCFPNIQRNHEKIVKEFRILPNSKQFKMEKVEHEYTDMDDLD